jgi:hypothetical protein
MNNEIEPNVGSWYQNLINAQVFQVVSLDEDAALVELQHADGDIEEIGLDEWHAMDLESTDAPDDWTGPIDDPDTGDFGFSDTRSEGERRGLAESRRSERLQSPDLQSSEAGEGDDEAIIERQPADEAGESEAISGTAREARRRGRRTRRSPR